MNAQKLNLAGTEMFALGTGALWWPEQALLCVSDLHFGKSLRVAQRGGAALPPYETRDTLRRLSGDLERTGARIVVCLGDSFDDLNAVSAIPESERLWITQMQAGRRWIWIEGNHDPGPIDMGGTHLSELSLPPLSFRHIARQDGVGEISGHYHPKAQVRMAARTISRPAFLVDRNRIILPAYGTYTGGLRSNDAALKMLMRQDALAILTGPTAHRIPMPR